MTMRIGIFGGMTATATLDEVIEAVRTAHEQGFPSFWMPQIFGYDALTVLAMVGRETEGIELATSVVPTYPRHPAMLAAQALTTQQAATGRFTLGIGASHQPVVEQMYGMSFEKPVRYMREYLEILMPLVDGKPASFDGGSLSAHVTLDVPDTRPVPVMVAALGPQMLDLAGSRTAGTITWMTGPKTIEAHIGPRLRAAADKAGLPDPRIACGLPVCVTDDVDRARQRAAKAFAIYGQLPSYRAMLDREGAEGPADVAVIGDEARVEARIRGLSDAGVTDFVASEFGSGANEETRTRDLLRTMLA